MGKLSTIPTSHFAYLRYQSKSRSMANIFNPYKSLQDKIRRNSVQASKRSDSMSASDLTNFLKKLQSDLLSNGRIS